MKTKSTLGKIAILFVSVFTLSSCEKVIQLDLNSKDAQIVIEGEVTNDSTTPQTVKITKTVNFDQSNQFPAVTGANVVISDNAGNNVTLAETSPGVYQSYALMGVAGRTYFLNITSNGKTYNSMCTMPYKVNLDTIQTIPNLLPGGDANSKSIVPIFKDPEGNGNYYRFKLKVNDKVSTGIQLIDDQIQDGGLNNVPIIDPNLSMKVGDSLTLKMMCISKEVRLYFYSLSQNGSGPNASATPANPVTNINGASLGYFSAHTIQTKKIKIQ